MTDVSAFTHAGLRTVTLPSGATVRGVMPTVEALMLRDLVPTDLIETVTKFATPGYDSRTLPSAERGQWYRYLRLLVAGFVRDLKDEDGNWQPLKLSIEDTFTMDNRDVDELEWIVLGYKTPAMVTAQWQGERGEITKEEANAIVEDEMSRTIGGWAAFRRVTASVADSPDGADVQQPAEPDAEPNRASRRARARRSVSTAPSS